MNCKDRDPDLLFYGLGELSLMRKGVLSLHMLFCKECRKRQTELAMTSFQVSEGLKSPLGSKLSTPALFNFKLTLAVALCCVIGVSSIVGTTIWRLQSHAPQKIADDGCRPDLPNDQCK